MGFNGKVKIERLPGFPQTRDRHDLSTRNALFRHSVASFTSSRMAQSILIACDNVDPPWPSVLRCTDGLGPCALQALQEATRSRHITSHGVRAPSSSSRQSSHHEKVLVALIGQTWKHMGHSRLAITASSR